jgi:hypothetical protein
MRAFFYHPVSHGIQLIKSGAGVGVKIQDMIFALPQFLHSCQAFKDEPDIAL